MIARLLSAPLLRALAVALGGALLAAAVAIVTLQNGHHAGAVLLEVLAPVGTACAIGIEWLRRRRTRLPRQLMLTGVLVVGQLIVIAMILSKVMFVSNRDGIVTALIALYAGLVGAWLARPLAQRTLGDLEALRDGLERIGHGERQLSLPQMGAPELDQLARDLEAMVGRLHSEERARAGSERARRELVAAVSHDLRTPITSLRLLADALDDDLVDADTRREYLTRMGTHVRTLSGLIDDLFELSRLEAGDIRWTMEQVPLAELVRETVEAMRPAAEARAVVVHAEVPSGLDPARANPEQIQRVLFNLIQNALRHTPADGSVTVRAGAADGRVEIEVCDTGEGIPEGERRRVFEAFFQGGLRGGARSDGGAGLGLAISRAIVEAHGGRIWLDDTAPAGTSVRFSLPVAA
ncbi:MAG TPA: HAMP domain-containing sensor histidine kinase [Solirubrobacteraceae bacterium]|jgi:signal transduction histidine kinase|nr:HAMP domain-containing sensor histidine kinase [Solirubrobacteraceae bacterium]